jgi:hypothetical protein
MSHILEARRVCVLAYLDSGQQAPIFRQYSHACETNEVRQVAFYKSQNILHTSL